MAEGRKSIARNRKAQFDYALGDRYEAGVVLTGSEIKSIRANKISLQDGFVQEQDGELWLLNVHISPYEQAGTYGYSEPLRPRKLLLNKKEIAQIISRTRERGYTVVPTEVYLKNGKAKIEIALAKGKKQYDKRQDIAKRDSDRELRQKMKTGRYED
ncbi:MAG: SsrA-binding protein SmpB [Chloroflexota bacterium]|nr:SsrA-binding protein SmpB [Chloroflexota bacterium]